MGEKRIIRKVVKADVIGSRTRRSQFVWKDGVRKCMILKGKQVYK